MEKLKMEMNELLKLFELMRSARVADNSRVVKEVCEKIISELDLRSLAEKGMGCLVTLTETLTCSSHTLVLLERLFLVPTHRYPMMKMATILWTRR
jgi:hypothetical protein